MALRKTPPASAKLERSYYSPKLSRSDIRNLYWAVAEGAPSCTFTADDMEGHSIEDFDDLPKEPIRKFFVSRYEGGVYMSLGIYPALAVFQASTLDEQAMVVERKITSAFKGKAKTSRMRAFLAPGGLFKVWGQIAFIFAIAMGAQLLSRHYGVGNPTTIYLLTLAFTAALVGAIARKTTPQPTIEVGARTIASSTVIALVGLVVALISMIGTYIQIAIAP